MGKSGLLDREKRSHLMTAGADDTNRARQDQKEKVVSASVDKAQTRTTNGLRRIMSPSPSNIAFLSIGLIRPPI